MATKTIVGEKVGMTQVWDDDNNVVPVTVLRVTPCRIVQVKSPETDGYSALQVTYGNRDPRKLNKPATGHYERAGAPSPTTTTATVWSNSASTTPPGIKSAKRSRSTCSRPASGSM